MNLKLTRNFTAPLAALVWAVLGLSLLAQGPLAPSAAPAPNMKSLQEIWDRIGALETQNQALQGSLTTLNTQNQELRTLLTKVGDKLVPPVWRESTVVNAAVHDVHLIYVPGLLTTSRIPYISFLDSSNNLKIAYRPSPAGSFVIETVATNVLSHAVTLGSGLLGLKPFFSFTDTSQIVKFATGDEFFGGYQIIPIGPGGASSIAYATAANARIAYIDTVGTGIKLATQAANGTWSIQALPVYNAGVTPSVKEVAVVFRGQGPEIFYTATYVGGSLSVIYPALHLITFSDNWHDSGLADSHIYIYDESSGGTTGVNFSGRVPAMSVIQGPNQTVIYSFIRDSFEEYAQDFPLPFNNARRILNYSETELVVEPSFVMHFATSLDPSYSRMNCSVAANAVGEPCLLYYDMNIADAANARTLKIPADGFRLKYVEIKGGVKTYSDAPGFGPLAINDNQQPSICYVDGGGRLVFAERVPFGSP